MGCFFWWGEAPERPSASAEDYGLDLRFILLDRTARRAVAQGAAMAAPAPKFLRDWLGIKTS
jgi:hypothetical protein